MQDSTTPHSWKYTDQALRRAYGDDWREHLRLEKLIGSGCIGQGKVCPQPCSRDISVCFLITPSLVSRRVPVYKGIVNDECGKELEVAIKVMHPNVLDAIDDDLELMRLAVAFVKKVPFDMFSHLQWLNMEGAVKEFAAMLKLQLDFRTEHANLVRFNKNFAHIPSVVFPKVQPFTEVTVLTNQKIFLVYTHD